MNPYTPIRQPVFWATKASILENSNVVATEPSSHASSGFVKGGGGGVGMTPSMLFLA